MEDSKSVETLAASMVKVSGSFDANIYIANLLV